jgi:uncharacterized protein YciI
MTSPTVPPIVPPAVQPVVPPLRREVLVACAPEDAFELFTAHIGAWWPLKTHSVHGARASVAFEDGVLVERLGTARSVWGEVVYWDRPNGFRMTWYPGHGPERATEVAVSFAPDADATLVTLTHSGWERLADPGGVRAEYEHGWPVVLEQYSRRLGAGGRDAESADRWFVLSHRPGPVLDGGGSVFAHPHFAEHLAFLERLADKGWLVAAGALSAEHGEGMTVLRVPAPEAARVEDLAMTDDQSVAQGLLTVTVRSWEVRLAGE